VTAEAKQDEALSFAQDLNCEMLCVMCNVIMHWKRRTSSWLVTATRV